jgi:hypothetical protein
MSNLLETTPSAVKPMLVETWLKTKGMKKITELTEMAWQTVHYRDEYGNIEVGAEEYEVYRVVKGISEGPRLDYFQHRHNQ